jgi:polygalacturonase
MPHGADPWETIAEPLRRISAPRIPAGSLVADLPAAGSDALPALTAAIAACHAGGGGRVVVPPGRHLLRGPLVLRSRVELHVPAGAELAFSGEPSDFLPPVFQRWEGCEVLSHAPLISARDAHDVALTGDGVIDGGGSRAFTAWQPLQGPDQARLRDLGRDGVAVGDRVFGAGTRLRPSMFQPIGCERVLLQGVTLRDSPFWVIHPTYCRSVIVRGVTVDSLNHNNDGCDPDSCEDVLVEGCTFRTGDDGVAIKSGRDQDAWRVGRPTRRVLIRDCTLASRINGLCIGSEMSGGVADVFIEDCRVAEAASALYLKGNRDRGGAIEDIRMRRISVGSASAALIRFEPNYKGRGAGVHPPAMRRVLIEEVTCALADPYALFIEGDPDRPVEDVRLSRITVERAARPVWLRHARGVRLEQVRVGGELLPATPPATPDGAEPLPLRA